MTIAVPHPRQDERLAALYSYEILDTDRELEFDEIAKLAAAICGTPISVINFIDRERQWFKAETGLGVRETPLATSLCSHVILESELVEIEDTLRDPRMADNPLCCGESGLRFYAGALLMTETGLPIGTLCVLDHEPKTLTALQRDTLRVLARQVMARLDLRKSLRLAAILRQEVDHRAKNSLQSLAAFTRIAAGRAQSAETAGVLSAINARMEAVARLHQQLYQTEDDSIIALKPYFEDLVADLARIMPEQVSIFVQCAQVHVTSREAVALGTMLNEAVTNAAKHAFPDGRPGRIEITVEREQPEGPIRIVFADDGVGLSRDDNTGGIGMQVTDILAIELQSDINVNSSPQGLTIEVILQSKARGSTRS